jgi:diguanylate cyclase (GGDEF)-like protein/PAS domain S-box-containing protein
VLRSYSSVRGWLARIARAGRALMPAGGGLRAEDWWVRHRLLTGSLLAAEIGLTVVGLVRGRLDLSYLLTTVLVGCCLLAAILLPGRRVPSCAVALGLTGVCTGLVLMHDGQTEAHFAFFVAVGALSLYRDWVPFGMFLVATVAGHATMGQWNANAIFSHSDAHHHPLRWAAIHGVAVLLTAATQVVAWRLSEIEEQRAGKNLLDAQAQFTMAFEEAPVAMTVMTGDARIVRANAVFTNWLGLPRVLPPGYTAHDLPLRRVGDSRARPFDRIQDADTPTLNELQRYQLDDGRMIEVEVHANALRDERGDLQMIISHFVDVTAERNQAALLYERARCDDLTGLLSRDTFRTDLGERMVSEDAQVSVIYLDLDRFKAVNDAFGHAIGDEVLRVFAGRVAQVCAADAVLARLGADEFAVAIGVGMLEAQHLAQVIVDSCLEPVEVAGLQVMIAVSAGVSTAVAGEQADAILWRADLAMYAAKSAGRRRVVAYDHSMRVASEKRVEAEQRLREALDGDRPRTLPVWFQPIVDLGDRRIVGAEALVRLRSGDGSLMSPAEFIPIAEETGLVIPLGQHVLHTALEQLERWGSQLSYISVNVSPRQLAEVGFVSMLTQELAASGLQDRSRLVLEITETAGLQTDVNLEGTFEEIQALGVRLALDDFGTGYSSLTWLQSIPADIVKLDRSFVAGLATDPDKAAIISAVLWLANALGMSVIAEGVEDPQDADLLAAAGCPRAQGYLFGRPMETEAFDEILSREPVPAVVHPSPSPGPDDPQAAPTAILPRPRADAADAPQPGSPGPRT